MNYNKAIIVGRVSQAPDLRSTPGGQPDATMGVATNRLWTDKSGQKHEDAEFHTVVLWGKLAELASMYLPKGALVLVEGRMETRTWEDNEGNPRKMTEIVAEEIQFGPKPAAPVTKAEEPKPTTDDVPIIDLDGDEEDTGRNMEEIPF
jgi:single-strand DNA-binding protein